MKIFDWIFGKKEQTSSESGPVLKGSYILGKLFKVWPELNPGCVWIADSNYVMPTKEELKKILFRSQINQSGYKSEMNDCDDYALFLHVDVIRQRYEDYKQGKISEDQAYPLAFGQIWYCSPTITVHAINICITCDKGILLIEPQQTKIFKPTEDMVIKFMRI